MPVLATPMPLCHGAAAMHQGWTQPLAVCGQGPLAGRLNVRATAICPPVHNHMALVQLWQQLTSCTL
jgi:hypothetical protein